MTSQRWDPEVYQRAAGFVAVLGRPLIELLNPRPGQRLLDLGCGDGRLTEELQALDLDVVGVDASPDQIAAAKARGLDARVMDGAKLTFEREFDAVLSNAALHWMKDPDAVIAGVVRALKPGGVFVAEMGGEGNVGSLRRALHAGLAKRGIDPAPHDPWYFPGAEAYGDKLRAAGFQVEEIKLFDRPTPLPGDLRDWLVAFAGSFVAALPEGEGEAYLDEVAEAVRPQLRTDDGSFVADYVRLRFRARL